MLILRNVKGSPLTYTEMDNNLTYLETLSTTGITLTNITGLPTYVDNAAAISGGLTLDDIYKTSTGELRIVV